MSDNQEVLEERRQELGKRLREDKEYREQYATSVLIENVSAQVQALRRQRGLTQKQLADQIGTKQPRISNVEVPPEGDGVPNWELDTLNRIAQALDTRLKISFETYGSLLDELDSVNSDSLRRSTVDHDSKLNPRPPLPGVDQDAPERTRWMQQRMIPWLWDEKLEMDTLIGWLQGYGLPPVGDDEDPSQWLLRGIPKNVDGKSREYMERQLAERLAIVLGEQPDVHALVSERKDEFLISLYSTCAGLNQRSFLAEPLWQTYKRLRVSKLSWPVRDALQAALVRNDEGDKPLREIWEPMVNTGRHRWLSGGEMTGYQGMVARRVGGKPDLETIVRAMGTISHRWSGTDADKRAFGRMIENFPERRKLAKAIKKYNVELSGWAHEAIFPRITVTKDPERPGIELVIKTPEAEVHAVWRENVPAYMTLKGLPGESRESLALSGPPRSGILRNQVLTQLGDLLDEIKGEEASPAWRMREALFESMVA